MLLKNSIIPFFNIERTLKNSKIPLFQIERTSIVKREGVKTDNETVGTEESEESDPIAFALCFDSMCPGGGFDDIEDISIEGAEGVEAKKVQPRSVTLVQSRADGIEVRIFTIEQSRQYSATLIQKDISIKQSRQYSATLIQSYARRFLARRQVEEKREEIRKRRAISEEAARLGHRRLMRLLKKERRKKEEQKLLEQEKAYNERNRKEKQKIRYKAAKEIRELNRLAADINYIENEIGSDLLPLKLACGGLECVDERQVPTKAKRKKAKPPIQQVICRIDKKVDSCIVEKPIPKEKRNGRIFGLFSKKRSSQDKKVIGEIETKQWDTDNRKDVNYDHRKSPRKSMETKSKSKSNHTKSSTQSSRPKEQPEEVKSKSVKRESKSRAPPIGVLIIRPKSEQMVPTNTKTKESSINKVEEDQNNPVIEVIQKWGTDAIEHSNLKEKRRQGPERISSKTLT
eukprot:CAMPEP_0195307048 /NCGR_PEP_ID=MMETSP0707-20130614/37518_1 /TAXON_ID=33640 /ORGANISM="Asterionellopsis glacialis, Strain CCMP134" /LENGTH=457 /DNA_ID=CAMNT_0040371289 /DNA_START=46 /DNA_END=1417 /DNA_ORIENTATION=-